LHKLLPFNSAFDVVSQSFDPHFSKKSPFFVNAVDHLDFAALTRAAFSFGTISKGKAETQP